MLMGWVIGIFVIWLGGFGLYMYMLYKKENEKYPTPNTTAEFFEQIDNFLPEFFDLMAKWLENKAGGVNKRIENLDNSNIGLDFFGTGFLAAGMELGSTGFTQITMKKLFGDDAMPNIGLSPGYMRLLPLSDLWRKKKKHFLNTLIQNASTEDKERFTYIAYVVKTCLKEARETHLELTKRHTASLAKHGVRSTINVTIGLLKLVAAGTLVGLLIIPTAQGKWKNIETGEIRDYGPPWH
jgi:hypothetical protein